MVIRHILLAGLAATASLAQAGVIEPSAAAAPTAAWSSVPTAEGKAAAANPLGALASPGKWTGHTRMGDRSATSTMLFTQKTSGKTAPVMVAAVESPAQSVPMAPVMDAPQADASIGSGAAADTSGLINAGGNVGVGIGAAIDAVDPAAVPEPATGMLMLAGLLGAGALVRRRK